jgi:hypothetical protein
MAAATSIIAAAGLAVSAGSAGMSFAQAGKQRKLQRQAESDAEQAMAEARKKLEVNYYDQLAIQKEPYELQREAMLSQGAQAIQAGVESERGSAATAGRIAMAQNEAQAGIRTEMGKELMALEKLSAEEDSRLRDMGLNLDLAEVQGAQQAAADAQRAAAAATTQGMQSIQSLGQQAIQQAPLYGPIFGAGKGSTTTAPASTATAPAATAPAMEGRADAPASKLSPFQTGVTAKSLAENQFQNSMQYRGGSKFGSPIMMPSGEAMYNYFQFYK